MTRQKSEDCVKPQGRRKPVETQGVESPGEVRRSQSNNSQDNSYCDSKQPNSMRKQKPTAQGSPTEGLLERARSRSRIARNKEY